jgi:hypothetical protein
MIEISKQKYKNIRQHHFARRGRGYLPFMGTHD